MHIKLVNIRFRLDGDPRDKEIHDALFQYPDGARNQLMKDALFAHLLGEGTERHDQQAPVPGSVKRKPPVRPSHSGKVKPEKVENADFQRSPSQVQEQPAPAGKPAEADSGIPAADKPTVGSGEDEHVLTGLRSMIL